MLDMTTMSCAARDSRYQQQNMSVSDEQQEGSSSSSSRSLEPESPNKPLKSKTVGFDRVAIRSYKIVLGDHPCCSTGCPVSLGWDYSQEEYIKLDEYEATRAEPVECVDDLRLSRYERHQLLLSTFSDFELQRAERDAALARRRLRRAQLATRFMRA